MRIFLGASLMALGLLATATAAPAASLRIGNGTGPLVTTSGPATNPNAAVNLGGSGNLLGGNGAAGSATPTALATTNLLSGGGLGGATNPTATVQIGVPGTGTGADGNTVTATLGAPDGSGGLGNVPSGQATVDLFGNDDTATLGGDGTDGSVNIGSIGDAGDGGLGTGDIGGGAAGTGIAGSSGSQMATIGGGTAGGCTGPSEAQIARFLALHKHGDVGAWRRASNVQVVPVKTCPAARGRLSAALGANGRVRAMQQAAASDALVSASLSRSHHGARNVIAVDQAGANLTVYVY